MTLNEAANEYVIQYGDNALAMAVQTYGALIVQHFYRKCPMADLVALYEVVGQLAYNNGSPIDNQPALLVD